MSFLSWLGLLPIAITYSSSLTEAVNVEVTKIDTIGSVDASLNAIKLYLDASINFGRNVRPTWVTPDISSNAGANSDLVTKTVGAGKVGYIYGWEIVSEDTSNNFTLNWTSGSAAKSLLIVFAGSGNAMHQYQGAAANEGFPCDPLTNCSIKNTVAAQTAKRLQARLLYAEV